MKPHPHAAALMFLLTGCTLGPDYQKPDVAAPAFKETSDWKKIRPASAVPRGSWWRVFGDSELNRLQDALAVSNNSLAAAEARYRQAQAVAAVASAALFPSINGNAAANRAQTAGHSNVQGSLQNTFSIGAVLNWELDLWGRVRRGTEAVNADTQAAAADLESVRLSTHALLAQTYFSLRVADSQQLLYQRSVADYNRSLEITRNLFAQGMNTKADIAAAETQLKATESQATDLKLQRAQLEHAIATLTGRPPASLAIAPGDLRIQPPAAPKLVASRQLERRPDIAAAERRLASSCAKIGIAEAGFFPVISLSGSAGYQNPSLDKLIMAPSKVWAFGAAASGPIFDAGATSGKVAQSRAVYDESLADYRQTVLTAFQEVEDNLAADRLLAQEAVSQDEAVKAAREATTIARNQYKAGTAGYLAVIVAQAAQLNAERAALSLLGRRLNASVVLFKTAGGNP